MTATWRRSAAGTRTGPVHRHLAVVFVAAMLLFGLPLRPVGAATRPSSRCSLTSAPLRGLAERSGRLIGAAYRSEYADADPCYALVADHEFTSLTPEIATFPNAVAPTPGSLQFDRADAVCREADRHGQVCGVHDVVWDPVDHPEWSIVPDWIKALPPEARHEQMLRLVTGAARHFGGRGAIYSLANEVFTADGTLAATTWNTTGDDRYLFDAYRAARLADPTAVLLYNEYGAEDLNPKSDAVYDLATRLHETTVDVRTDGRTVAKPLLDGVGLQSHFGTGPGQMPSLVGMARNIDRLGRAGLSVYLTELDVRVPVTAGQPASADLRTQAELYRKVVATCLDTSVCQGITLWGFTDAHSWITDNPSTFTGQGAAHPFDGSYTPKGAYRGLRRAFTDAAPRRPGSATPSRPVSGAESRQPSSRRTGLVVLAGVALVVTGVLVAGRRRRTAGSSA